MAKDSRGTKREDPETGRKFYDLNRDPIVSPYTGKSYPRSFFEQTATRKGSEREEDQDDQEETEIDEATTPAAASDEPEVISLEDADAEESGGEEEIPEVEDVEEVEDIGEDEDAFLEEDDDEEDENLDFDVGSDER